MESDKMRTIEHVDDILRVVLHGHLSWCALWPQDATSTLPPRRVSCRVVSLVVSW